MKVRDIEYHNLQCGRGFRTKALKLTGLYHGKIRFNYETISSLFLNFNDLLGISTII